MKGLVTWWNSWAPDQLRVERRWAVPLRGTKRSVWWSHYHPRTMKGLDYLSMVNHHRYRLKNGFKVAG